MGHGDDRMTARAKAHGTVRLKPADPFQLIRWLARSQPDPRKAVAELVQNSLDAGATHVTLRRHRARGVPCLSILDDGHGVLPDASRDEALRYLATHVGHSRKAGLDAAARAEQVIAGKYGVGLLGFWSIGVTLELRTRVAGSPLFAMRMHEDKPAAEIVELPRRTDAPETFTEAVVVDLHAAAQRALVGRRLADYLASELRGQILAHKTHIVIHDELARGLAQKAFVVVPKRFVGERLDLPNEIDVPGFARLRVELYASRGEAGGVQVACAGTMVADDVAALDALGLAVDPWVGRGLLGIVDFASFNVPPGTRRGVMPDRAAAAFADAMEALAPRIGEELARFETVRAAVVERDVARDLRRALRGFARRLPQYDLPHVDAESGEAEDVVAGEPLAPPSPPSSTPSPEPELFPPGPLATVEISPAAIAIALGAERRVTAHACDASGRAIEGAHFTWSVASDSLMVRGDGARPAVCTRAEARIGDTSTLSVEARKAPHVARAEAVMTIVRGKCERWRSRRARAPSRQRFRGKLAKPHARHRVASQRRPRGLPGSMRRSAFAPALLHRALRPRDRASQCAFGGERACARVARRDPRTRRAQSLHTTAPAARLTSRLYSAQR